MKANQAHRNNSQTGNFRFSLFGDGPSEFAMTIDTKSSAQVSAPVTETQNVYSNQRTLQAPNFQLGSGLELNTRLQMEGQQLLERLPTEIVPVVFFDPQYRGVLDKLGYGNEGKTRGKARAELQQMTEEDIGNFVRAIDRVLIPMGHLFLWMDKFHLCNGFTKWLDETSLSVVDMITWSKQRIGMGYRTRRSSEHLLVIQKQPTRAKGVWRVHDIPDVIAEKVSRNGGHTHNKPVGLQARVILAVTNPGDVVVDPAAGSFSVLEACQQTNRNFLGCDLNG